MISSPAALASALLLATTAVGATVPDSPALKRQSTGKCAGKCAEIARLSGGAEDVVA